MGPVVLDTLGDDEGVVGPVQLLVVVGDPGQGVALGQSELTRAVAHDLDALPVVLAHLRAGRAVVVVTGDQLGAHPLQVGALPVGEVVGNDVVTHERQTSATLVRALRISERASSKAFHCRTPIAGGSGRSGDVVVNLCRSASTRSISPSRSLRYWFTSSVIVAPSDIPDDCPPACPEPPDH